MKLLLKTTTAMLAFAAVPFILMAQWPDYRTGNVPRDAKGEPMMEGPTPRTPDGKVDFSGIWSFRGGGGFGKGKQAPPRPANEPPPANFANLGRAFGAQGLPLKPVAKMLLDARAAENSKDNPDAHCLPLGLMQLHTHPQPRKIIQTPSLMVMLFEAQAGIRQIFTDGRKLPPKDVQPWWYAYSVGHWEGDEMVVETTGFRDDVWLDIDGSPLTNAGKMTERFRRPNYGSLEIDVTFEDPDVYTKPWTVRVSQRIMPDTDLIEFICQENDRSGPHLVGQ